MAFTNRDKNKIDSEIDLLNYLDSSSLFAIIKMINQRFSS